MDPQPVQPAQDLQQQVITRIKDASNVLVTVSNNPSVDQLAAAIGFTLVLNKLKKHGTAVFSGAVPSIIEFLEPEKTLEKNTDSLRDFIIALDKAKADKLRYKIEDKYVVSNLYKRKRS
jgi:nanoRNase/pAp phosphatase (c-di-AMP/oligoRNAs hydrolase)